MCTVPSHIASGSALIDAWPTPIMSAYHSVYSNYWMLVPDNPPLGPPPIRDPIESEMAYKYW